MMLHSIVQPLQVFQTRNFKMVEIFPFTCFSQVSPFWGNYPFFFFVMEALESTDFKKGVFSEEKDYRMKESMSPCFPAMEFLEPTL